MKYLPLLLLLSCCAPAVSPGSTVIIRETPAPCSCEPHRGEVPDELLFPEKAEAPREEKQGT